MDYQQAKKKIDPYTNMAKQALEKVTQEAVKRFAPVSDAIERHINADSYEGIGKIATYETQNGIGTIDSGGMMRGVDNYWYMPNTPDLPRNGEYQPPTPAPTATPTPQPPQPQVQGASNDGFRFAYETMPVDEEWRKIGPRPNFNPIQPPPEIGRIIREVFPGEATAAATIAVSEDGNFNPRGENLWNGEGMGIDRGIFAINSNTFNGLMSRQGDKLRKMGITSFEDMYDPKKNAQVAKLIRDGARAYRPETNPQGWGGWYGWQDTGYEMNDGYYTKNDRVAHEEKQKRERKKK